MLDTKMLRANFQEIKAKLAFRRAKTASVNCKDVLEKSVDLDSRRSHLSP